MRRRGPDNTGDGGSGDGGRGDEDSATPEQPMSPLGFLRAMRQAATSGAEHFRSEATVPPGRADRLGLTAVDNDASDALSLPFEFLRVGDDRGASAELAGSIDGLGSRVFEFKADEFVPARSPGADSGLVPTVFCRYHVAAVELGFSLPWFAIAARRLRAPSQKIYPDRRGHDLPTTDRQTSRDYVLYADDVAVATGVLDASVQRWLTDALAVRFQHRSVVALEVGGGWAMAAIQAGAIFEPDEVALRSLGRKGHPGPWPDVLLRLLAEFREHLRPYAGPGA